MCRVFFIFKESFPGFARMRVSHEDWISLKGEGQLNDPFLLEHAGHACERLAISADLEDTEQAIAAAYLQILSRTPSPAELARCREYLAKQIDVYRSAESAHDAAAASRLAVTDLCHMLICANEFLYLQ